MISPFAAVWIAVLRVSDFVFQRQISTKITRDSRPVNYRRVHRVNRMKTRKPKIIVFHRNTPPKR